MYYCRNHLLLTKCWEDFPKVEARQVKDLTIVILSLPWLLFQCVSQRKSGQTLMIFLASNVPWEAYIWTWECLYWLHVFTPCVWLQESQVLVEPCSPCTEIKLFAPWLKHWVLQVANRTGSQVPIWCIFWRVWSTSFWFDTVYKSIFREALFSKKVLILQLTTEGHLLKKRFSFLCTASISVVVSKKGVQGFTCTLSTQTQQYVLHTTNKILFISNLGITRKCNWAWSCWLTRKTEIRPKPM